MVLQFFLLGLFCIIQNKKLEGNRKYDLDNVILLSVDMKNKKQHKDNKRERTMVNSMLVSTHLWSSGTNDWLQRKYSSIKKCNHCRNTSISYLFLVLFVEVCISIITIFINWWLFFLLSIYKIKKFMSLSAKYIPRVPLKCPDHNNDNLNKIIM